MPDGRILWGEIHTHTALSDGNGSPEDNLEIGRSHLDFWAMADHACDPEVFNLDYRQMVPERRVLNECWGEVQDLCRTSEIPGAFVPFLAYEWTNFRYGHHNVYYLDYDQPIRMPPTLPGLYESLRGVDAMVIPHHGGYPVGVCGKDWRIHDEELSPFVEIYSFHGSSEGPEGIRPLLTRGSWMGPGASGGSVQEGLALGYTLGIMASSDSHGQHPGAYDNGLVAAYADDLSRPALWEAFRTRRIYGVTGDRISLDFHINGRPMGSVMGPSETRLIDVSVLGWDKVDRVDVLRNNAVIHSFAEPVGQGSAKTAGVRFRFMVEWGWDVRADHDWTGALRVTGGRILQAVPCYRGRVADRAGRGITSLTTTACRWTSRTPKPAVWGFSRSSADAIAFEAEVAEDGRMEFAITCDGRDRLFALKPAEILAGSRVEYMEDIPQTNNGAYWHSMQDYAKVKVHQGRLTEHLTLGLAYEDCAEGPPNGRRDFYYVRVVQRNGQMAWSSPIWVMR